jgi:transposase-like protein
MTHQRDVVSDQFVPDPQVCREFSITSTTLWRWDRDPDLNFPPVVKIRNGKFRSRRQFDEFKANMVRRAIERRGPPSRAA